VADKAGEYAGQANFTFEAESEGDVFDAIVIVVHMHLVQNAGIERKIIWPIRRFQEWINVQNHGYSIRMIKADKGKPVSDVGLLIEGGNGRFTMAGGKTRARQC